MFWVISVYLNIRDTLPKSGTFLLGHPVYNDFTFCAVYETVGSEHLKFLFIMFCVILVSRSKLLSGKEVLDTMNVLDQYLITDSNENA